MHTLLPKPKEERFLKTLEVDRMIILKCILRVLGCDNVDQIYLAQDRDQRWALVKQVITFVFNKGWRTL
jgi:hypothetical protein